LLVDLKRIVCYVIIVVLLFLFGVGLGAVHVTVDIMDAVKALFLIVSITQKVKVVFVV
jgi:hypothetical protein